MLTLGRDQRYRGAGALILNDHVTRLDALGEHAYAAFMQDLRQSVRAIQSAVAPDHMNVALLGNSCPHLHWGIVPRRRDDPRWRRPVWDDATLESMRHSPVRLTDMEYDQLAQAIRQLI